MKYQLARDIKWLLIFSCTASKPIFWVFTIKYIFKIYNSDWSRECPQPWVGEMSNYLFYRKFWERNFLSKVQICFGQSNKNAQTNAIGESVCLSERKRERQNGVDCVRTDLFVFEGTLTKWTLNYKSRQ